MNANSVPILPLLITLSLIPVLRVRAAGLPAVPAMLQPLTNTYHGTFVVDNYQWMEDASAPAVKEWTRLENERTREYFDHLKYRDGLAQQLMQLRSEESARIFGFEERKGRIFALRFKPPAQQPVLVRLSSLHQPVLWRTV